MQWVLVASVAAVLVIGALSADTIWSPYYRLQIGHRDDTTFIDANGVPHQTAVPVGSDPDYDLIYQRLASPPSRVLVIGAGNGNDVATALAHGAQSVDAVEIDPKLMEIGVEFHPSHPYQDPRVHRIIDDGRAFLERTHNSYDLIIFALARLPDPRSRVSPPFDSRAISSREQAFEAARDHLAPGGAFAMYNFYREQWLADRLAGTLTGVFGNRPCFDLGQKVGTDVGQFSVFVDGSDQSSLRCSTVWDPDGRTVVAPAVDDRPFLYLRSRTIPGKYLATLFLVLLASLIGVWTAGGAFKPMARYVDLFFMGAAFLLLETKAVVQFALLFGTTWFVNALVFAGVLAIVLLAIEVERRIHIGRPLLLFGLLFLGLARRMVGSDRRAPRILGRPEVPARYDARVLPDLRSEPDLRGAVQGYGRPHGRVRGESLGRDVGRNARISVAARWVPRAPVRRRRPVPGRVPHEASDRPDSGRRCNHTGRGGHRCGGDHRVWVTDPVQQTTQQ